MITSCCLAVASEAQFLFLNFGGDRFTNHWPDQDWIGLQFFS